MGNERPILFSGAMVRAILAGTKRQTRRVVKLPGHTMEERDDGTLWPHCSTWSHGDDGTPWATCPYGVPGDRLWVRETWAAGKCAEGLPPSCLAPAFWLGPRSDNGGLWYAADDAQPLHAVTPRGKWRPSIHMPRWASRIALAVESVRVERLHDITEADITAEGVTPEVVAKMLRTLASKVRTEPGYWFSGTHADPEDDWCLSCAQEKSKKLRKAHPKADTRDVNPDGGWSQEQDSEPFCKGCGVRLDCSLTDYGIEQEIDHFDGRREGAIDTTVAYELERIMDLSRHYPEHSAAIARIAWWAAWTLINGAESWSANPWVWVVGFSRVTL